MQSRSLLIAALALLACNTVTADEPHNRFVVLVTIDGLRGEEVFNGADRRLLNRENGGVRNLEETRQRFWAEQEVQRRERLMPFLWTRIASRGQLLGDPAAESQIRVTNGRFFSYPGYNELLSGFADKSIDSNAKKPNANVTVLEWLNRKPRFRNQVAAFGSWDVFPFILNAPRAKFYVNAGWQPLDVFASAEARTEWNSLGRELPRVWDNVRYDAFTHRGAMEYLTNKRPSVLYVALGETDDWAHDGRYDLYLDAAHRSDQYVAALWKTLQADPHYKGKTSLLITTDHGRGLGRESWKSHGSSHAGSERIWAAVIGPDTPASGVVRNYQATQSQIAATIAAFVREDFTKHDPRIANPLPGVIRLVAP